MSDTDNFEAVLEPEVTDAPIQRATVSVTPWSRHGGFGGFCVHFAELQLDFRQEEPNGSASRSPRTATPSANGGHGGSSRHDGGGGAAQDDELAGSSCLPSSLDCDCSFSTLHTLSRCIEEIYGEALPGDLAMPSLPWGRLMWMFSSSSTVAALCAKVASYISCALAQQPAVVVDVLLQGHLDEEQLLGKSTLTMSEHQYRLMTLADTVVTLTEQLRLFTQKRSLYGKSRPTDDDEDDEGDEDNDDQQNSKKHDAAAAAAAADDDDDEPHHQGYDSENQIVTDDDETDSDASSCPEEEQRAFGQGSGRKSVATRRRGEDRRQRRDPASMTQQLVEAVTELSDDQVGRIERAVAAIRDSKRFDSRAEEDLQQLESEACNVRDRTSNLLPLFDEVSDLTNGTILSSHEALLVTHERLHDVHARTHQETLKLRVRRERDAVAKAHRLVSTCTNGKLLQGFVEAQENAFGRELNARRTLWQSVADHLTSKLNAARCRKRQLDPSRRYNVNNGAGHSSMLMSSLTLSGSGSTLVNSSMGGAGRFRDGTNSVLMAASATDHTRKMFQEACAREEELTRELAKARDTCDSLSRDIDARYKAIRDKARHDAEHSKIQRTREARQREQQLAVMKQQEALKLTRQRVARFRKEQNEQKRRKEEEEEERRKQARRRSSPEKPWRGKAQQTTTSTPAASTASAVRETSVSSFLSDADDICARYNARPAWRGVLDADESDKEDEEDEHEREEEEESSEEEVVEVVKKSVKKKTTAATTRASTKTKKKNAVTSTTTEDEAAPPPPPSAPLPPPPPPSAPLPPPPPPPMSMDSASSKTPASVASKVTARSASPPAASSATTTSSSGMFSPASLASARKGLKQVSSNKASPASGSTESPADSLTRSMGALLAKGSIGQILDVRRRAMADDDDGVDEVDEFADDCAT